MQTIRRAAMGLAAALAVAAAPAAAQKMVEAARPDSVVAALQGAGYKAVLEKDDIGEPKITSAANGAKFTIFFYGCDEHVRCKSLQFYAGYTVKAKPGIAKTNEWNQKNRFAAAFIDKDGDPNIQWDVITDGGMPEKLFIGTVERWATAMGAFQAFVGF